MKWVQTTSSLSQLIVVQVHTRGKTFLALFSTVLRPLTGNIKLINDNPNSWQYNTAEREDTVDANWIMVKLKFKMF